MRIRAVFLDLDGTLVGASNTVSPAVKKALRQARAAGCNIVLCTGRSRITTEPVARQIDLAEYAVVSNGAVVLHLGTREILCCNRIPRPTAVEVIRAMLEAGANPQVYEDTLEGNRILYHPDRTGELYAPQRQQPWPLLTHPLPFEPINISAFGPEEQLRPLAEVLAQNPPPGTFVEQAGTHATWCVEVHHHQSGKCNGLKRVAERLGVCREEVLAVGDHINDVEMLRFAGVGVAMGNALPEVRDAADFVTGTLEEDGVAQAIERFVLDRAPTPSPIRK